MPTPTPSWANSHAPSAFSFVACSGAVTSDVLNSQLSAVASDTELVTISIGGNDAGRRRHDRLQPRFGRHLRAAQQRGAAVRQDHLPGRLDSVYSAIRGQAPAARIVVVGSPHIYQLSGDCSVGLSETRRAAINSSADVLAEVTAARAGAHGFSFLDARSAFGGHEICSSGTWWLHSVTWPIQESYHPTSGGQSGGYYAALRGITG